MLDFKFSANHRVNHRNIKIHEVNESTNFKRFEVQKFLSLFFYSESRNDPLRMSGYTNHNSLRTITIEIHKESNKSQRLDTK